MLTAQAKEFWVISHKAVQTCRGVGLGGAGVRE